MQIVVAEDNALQRRAMAMVLRAEGLVVEEAADGVEALAAMQRGHASLLITDGEMPRMDGVELTRVLRQRGDATPVIMVSGQGTEGFVAAAREAGVSHYLPKPVDFRALLSLMARTTGQVGAAA